MLRYHTVQNGDMNATWTRVGRAPDSCDSPQMLTSNLGDYMTFSFSVSQPRRSRCRPLRHSHSESRDRGPHSLYIRFPQLTIPSSAISSGYRYTSRWYKGQKKRHHHLHSRRAKRDIRPIEPAIDMRCSFIRAPQLALFSAYYSRNIGRERYKLQFWGIGWDLAHPTRAVSSSIDR